MASRETDPERVSNAIQAFGRAVVRREVTQALARLEEPDDHRRRVLERMADRIVARLLDPPLRAIAGPSSSAPPMADDPEPVSGTALPPTDPTESTSCREQKAVSRLYDALVSAQAESLCLSEGDRADSTPGESSDLPVPRTARIGAYEAFQEVSPEQAERYSE